MPTPEAAAPWCREAWFVLSLHGDGQGTSLHRGWEAICEALVAAHYFQPDDDQRAEVIARFTDWEIWENVGGLPWRWFSDYEDGGITVERVTDGEAIDRFAAQRGAEEGGERYRHKKRGTTYQVVGVASSQVVGEPIGEGSQAVVYRSEDDGSLWVRPYDEFHDGRFERIEGLQTGAGEAGERARLAE